MMLSFIAIVSLTTRADECTYAVHTAYTACVPRVHAMRRPKALEIALRLFSSTGNTYTCGRGKIKLMLTLYYVCDNGDTFQSSVVSPKQTLHNYY